MNNQVLTTDDGLRRACESIGRADSSDDEWSEWIRQLAETIQWVREADQKERGTEGFQRRLWEDNHVAALGQGNISVDKALGAAGFRHWLATKSMEPLPISAKDQLLFLTTLYEDLITKLKPFTVRVPHLKIFRVMAAVYPAAMTTVADRGALKKLTRAMGGGRGLDAVECHWWTRRRLDKLLGEPSDEPLALAERMSLPWMLYERFVQGATPLSGKGSSVDTDVALKPLPAARRRRGLTPIRGLFQGALSALEFVREGVTRQELMDFLRASSPDAKDVSLGMTINVLQSELGAIRRDGERYVLTESGEDLLESEGSRPLADWILTRILGPDAAIVQLRDRGPLPVAELTAAVRSLNPGLTSDFVPQAVVSWLRSLGIVETSAQGIVRLTDAGREWGSLIHWSPESLSSEPDLVIRSRESTGVSPIPLPSVGNVVLPDLTAIVASVQATGHFSEVVICQLHAGLWSHQRRHFAILTGLSGSGKTLLARAYAKALTQGGSDRQLFTLPVQPGWYDPGALLGYTNPLRGDSYMRTAFLDFLIAAVGDPGHAYVAVLDEMNLSHPEQYMAPLLSAMETGDSIQLHTEGDFLDGVPPTIPYPSNLVLIGTVNMDETTHGLSDKVLDRAFVHEFWEVDLAAYPNWDRGSVDPNHEGRVRAVLVALMVELSPARLHFGWRVVDDVLAFLNRAASAGDALTFDVALDGVIYAKVLPKLRGEDSPRFQKALKGCEDVLTKFGLERSRTKVAELRRDLETTGSARFWR